MDVDGAKKRCVRCVKDSVVIGNVSADVGEGSVVIASGSIDLRIAPDASIAIGRGSHAEPGSIAIGTGATVEGHSPDFGKLLAQFRPAVGDADADEVLDGGKCCENAVDR